MFSLEYTAYVGKQMVWMAKETLHLVMAMGVGLKWMMMTVRCFTFAIVDLMYFIPHVIWYLLSPRIIRRVSYRCSKRTKKRNLAKLVSLIKETEPLVIPQSSTKNRRSRRSVSTHSTSSSASAPSTVGPLGEPIGGEDELLERTLKALRRNTAFEDCNFDDSLIRAQRSFARRGECLAMCSPDSAPVSPPLDQHLVDSFVLPRSSMQASENDDDEDDVDDAADENSLHNRATTDIYLPVPLDSLFHAIDERDKRKAAGDLNFDLKKFPIIISVNGGAWIVGCYFWNFLVARVLASRGYLVFCPDYRNFPQADMEGMTLDVSDAIGWVLRNAGRYNGDLDDVTLVGQSAGAHLTMMSLLSQAHLNAYKAKGGRRSGLQPPSSVAYNVPRYNPRQSIHRYIGLSGVYDVRHLIRHFNGRGLYRHVLHQIAGGRSKLPRYSINAYFDPKRAGDTGEQLPDNFFDFLPSKMFFLHGDADCSAPVNESAKLVHVMRTSQRESLMNRLLLQRSQEVSGSGGRHSSSVGGDAIPPPCSLKYVLIPGANHTDAIIEEPLAVGNSHLAVFVENEREKEGSTADGMDVIGASGGMLVSPAQHDVGRFPEGMEDDDNASPFELERNPDEVLDSPAPHPERPVLLRVASFVCPF